MGETSGRRSAGLKRVVQIRRVDDGIGRRQNCRAHRGYGSDRDGRLGGLRGCDAVVLERVLAVRERRLAMLLRLGRRMEQQTSMGPVRRNSLGVVTENQQVAFAVRMGAKVIELVNDWQHHRAACERKQGKQRDRLGA
ncbi:MAG: hypothetical protein QM723_13030 [Myxococcaceae bacterium]